MNPITLLVALLHFLSASTICLGASVLALDAGSNCTVNHTMPYPTRTHIRTILAPLSQPPSGTDQFFANVRDDVKYTVTGNSFLSGVWYDKASYRAATYAKIATLVKAPGIALKVAEGDEGVIVGQNGWATADLYTVDTYTVSGVLYNQSYAWHMRFDQSGLIAEVKTWLDTLTLENVLGAEAAKQRGTATATQE